MHPDMKNESPNAKALMYRYRNNGLEVFIEKNEHGEWTFPDLSEEDKVKLSQLLDMDDDEHIELEPVTCEQRKRDMLAYAFEVDWRRLPDSSHRRQFLEANKGAFVAVKEALKKNLPAEYKMLKELVEVLSIRNIIKNL